MCISEMYVIANWTIWNVQSHARCTTTRV